MWPARRHMFVCVPTGLRPGLDGLDLRPKIVCSPVVATSLGFAATRPAAHGTADELACLTSLEISSLDLMAEGREVVVARAPRGGISYSGVGR